MTCIFFDGSKKEERASSRRKVKHSTSEPSASSFEPFSLFSKRQLCSSCGGVVLLLLSFNDLHLVHAASPWNTTTGMSGPPFSQKQQSQTALASTTWSEGIVNSS